MDPQLDRFEQALRQAMPPVRESGNLSLKISNAIGKAGSRSQVNRRLIYAFVATVAICVAFLAAPTVSAHAAMQRMAGALDDVSKVKITDYAVGQDGARTAVRTTSYIRGAWRRDEIATGRATIQSGGKNYTYDPTTNVYIVEDKPGVQANLGTFRLSTLVMQAGAGNDKKIVIEPNVPLHGRSFNRAVIDNPMFRERILVYADAKTDLPMYVQIEGQERGRWVMKAESVLDYNPTFKPDTFQPGTNGTKIVTQRKWLERLAARVTSQELGSLPLYLGRLIIRSIFVDTDGTIFVAYQAHESTPNQWRGFGLQILDENGVQYARQEIMGNLDDQLIKHLPDGKLEVEAFVPIEPLSKASGNFKLVANLDGERRLVRTITMVVVGPEGEKTYKTVPNWQMGQEGSKLGLATIGDYSKADYTSSSLEALLPSLDGMLFNNDISKELYKARVRSRYYMEKREADNARRWLYEQLHLCDEYESRGYGPRSREQIYEDLDKLNELGLSSGDPAVTKERR